jgi:flagellar biosynthesis chaperone FliJ
MKIDKLNFIGLRNDEHFQFHTELRDLVNKIGAAALKVDQQLKAYVPLYNQEDEALKKIMKSAITAELQDADKRRDRLFRGMVDINKAAMNHFNEKVQEAAKRLKILFDTYGNLAQKPLNEETSAIYNLLQELNGKYAADVALVKVTDWTAELGAANEAFARLMKDRYEETAMRTDLVLKECRQRVDEAYRAMAERIGALVIIEGAAQYADFIRRLNVVIAKYAVALSRRKKTTNNEQRITDNEQ